jgi:hypothetical protein
VEIRPAALVRLSKQQAEEIKQQAEEIKQQAEEIKQEQQVVVVPLEGPQ